MAVTAVLRLAVGLLILAGLGGAGSARSTPLPVSRPPVAESAAIAARLGPSGVSGWMVVDLADGRILDAHRPGHGFVPASVAKLATALYALDRLGPSHRFETRVLAYRRGAEAPPGLVLAGGGDPELDSDDLVGLVDAVRAADLAEAPADLVVDGSAAPAIGAIDPDQPVDAAYNPGVSGLNLNFNRVRLRWGAAVEGLSLTAAARRSDPVVGSIAVLPDPAQGGSVSLRMEEGREVWRFPPGALNGQGARWLPVQRPALYAGEAFRELAGRAGLALPAPRLGGVPAGAEPVARHLSRPLPEILRGMLKYSTNLSAEALGLAASRAAGAPVATLAASAARMNAWAARWIGGGPAAGRLALANHSGLTLQSRVAPWAMVALLRRAARAPAPDGLDHPRLPGVAAALLAPYAIAAESVPIDSARIGVVAKTGTMDFVRGLAGYVVTPGDRRLAFAIFSNDLSRRRAGRRAGARWRARARTFERALLRHWIARADPAASR